MKIAGRWWWRLGFLLVLVGITMWLVLGPYRGLFGAAVGSQADRRPDPCLPGEAVDILDSPHIVESELASVKYNTDPPTSGPHFGFTLSPGIYTDPVSYGLVVHALEHGHIVIHYAEDLSRQDITELQGIARLYNNNVVLTPNTTLTDEIVLTAWGRIERLADYEPAVIIEFVEALRNRFNHGWTQAAC